MPWFFRACLHIKMHLSILRTVHSSHMPYCVYKVVFRLKRILCGLNDILFFGQLAHQLCCLRGINQLLAVAKHPSLLLTCIEEWKWCQRSTCKELMTILFLFQILSSAFSTACPPFFLRPLTCIMTYFQNLCGCDTAYNFLS